MRMEFDHGVLSLENAAGRKWQIANVDKPQLSFAYDALSVTNVHALRRIGSNVQPLTKREIDEVTAFVARQAPPSQQKQFSADLKVFAYGLINTAITQLEFGNLLDVQVAAREGSTDLRARKARQLLAYVDSVWNSYHALAAQIAATPDDELDTFTQYANMMPMIPKPSYFRGTTTAAANSSAAPNGAAADLEGRRETARNEIERSSTVTASDVQKSIGNSAGRPVKLETGAPEKCDFSTIVDRAFVFDDFFPTAQIQLYEQWAMQTPHWMLANSSHDEDGHAKHRIWGASFIELWRRKGWAGLPPVLFSIIAAVFQKLDISITEPEYIGLNGQSKGQTASMHTDCAYDSPDDLSILVYFGEDTDGDLLLYDKADRARLLHTIAFKPNRVVVFDGSVPHQAFAPTDDKFRMSMIIRGKYKVGAADLVTPPGNA